MHYFFIDEETINAGMTISLQQEDIKHAHRVLRLNVGEIVGIADGRGRAFRGEVVISGSDQVRVALKAELNDAESDLEITLVQSILKGDKMDQVIRQSVELGVKKFIPLITARSIPRRNAGQDEHRLERWRAIVRSSAAQCRRSFLPPLERPLDLKQFADVASDEIILVPYEGENAVPIGSVLTKMMPASGRVSILIGPEGGLESGEISRLHQAGAKTVSLGQRILRSETAAITAIVLTQAAWGDLAGKVDH